MQIKKEYTREQIVTVAKGVFLKKGFAKTSMRDIAKGCGIGVSNIYNYFIDLGGQEIRVQRITSGDEEDEKYTEGKEVGIKFIGEKYYPRQEVANV